MPEKLSAVQIRLLLYFLEAEPKKRTVTDAARHLNKPKSTLTHILDSLDGLALMQRVPGRKSVLTAAGKSLAQKLQYRRRILEKYLQYLDLSPAQAKEDAMALLEAGVSDEFMSRLEEQEHRMRLKEIFAGRRSFHGGELCSHLGDGSYHFPFIVYREQMKNHTNLSMANRGFEHPCELIVKDHEGMLYLTTQMMSAESAASGKRMEGRVNRLQYLCGGEFREAGHDGRYVYFPVTALRFISMGKGRDTLLHGSVCLRMQCSVGNLHMPESTAVFTMFIH